MSDQISTKDLISKFKDYADIADASYAMLHWVNENEEDRWFDEFKDKPPARWKFANGVAKGDKITEDNQTRLAKKIKEKSANPPPMP